MSEASRRRLAWKTRILSLIVIVSNAAGNTSLSWGMKHQAADLAWSPLPYVEAIFNPWVCLGIALLTMYLLTRMALLSWADLSYVLPATSFGYVLSAAMSVWFLAEQISWQRWTGTLLIVGGTILAGLTDPKTTQAVEPRA